VISTNYGPLVPEDELLTHQIVDTFATVSQSDPTWTEKIWTIAHAKDNSLQLVLGVGKYTNLGVFDAAAGVCRGNEQWTVRGSRSLSPNPSRTAVGPIRYEVTKPLEEIRVVLDPQEHQPISFDVIMRGSFPPTMEIPWPERSADGYRVSHDLLRYHQIGVAEGWVAVDGVRTDIKTDEWISIRDHSWGLRPGVGLPNPGLPHREIPDKMLLSWLPMTLRRSDGSTYSLFVFIHEETHPGRLSIQRQAEQQNDDGTSHRFAGVEQDFYFQDDNRRFTHGTVTLIDADGSRRPVKVEAAGSTGFYLATGGYLGYQGRNLGQRVGDFVVDGNHVTDTDDPKVAHELHQLRDLLVRVEDPVGGGVGFGNLETFAVGEFPERGLTAQNSFR
jgi:hypothetical protein